VTGTAIGSRRWARETCGRLDLPTAAAVLAGSIASATRSLPGQVRVRLSGLDERAGSGGQPPPDSTVARAVEERLEGAEPFPIVEHSRRCWLLADVVARHENLDVDREVLYLAALLHDIALLDGLRPDANAECFAVHGAEIAANWLDAFGAPALADPVAEAISLHYSPRVDPTRYPEGFCLRAAAWFDAVGDGLTAIPGSDVHRILSTHPRDGFAAIFADRLAEERTSRPRSRAGLLGAVGTNLFVRHNPLDTLKGTTEPMPPHQDSTPPC
jgi:hypothetical protein